MEKEKSVVNVHLNPIKNALLPIQDAIKSNNLEGILIVGKYKDNAGYIICRTPMEIAEEVNLAAQLSANVQLNYADKIFHFDL